MWSSDYQLPSREWSGEWLYDVIAENVHLELHGFMPDHQELLSRQARQSA
jgi:hypothetical protein